MNAVEFCETDFVYETLKTRVETAWDNMEGWSLEEGENLAFDVSWQLNEEDFSELGKDIQRDQSSAANRLRAVAGLD